MNELVLIGCFKKPADLEIAEKKRWYRIPLEHAPKRRFTHIAFYQPATFGKDGKQIRFYAGVTGCAVSFRKKLLPGEPSHPRANRLYCKYSLSGLKELDFPILNTSTSRISFGYTTPRRLFTAGDILGLFEVPPLERILYGRLKREGLNFSPEHIVMKRSRPGGPRQKYRLDFAVFCKKGMLDIECDGQSWHSHPAQKHRDKLRDLWLKGRGWTVMRLGEKDITKQMPRTARKIKHAIKNLGGIKHPGNVRGNSHQAEV